MTRIARYLTHPQVFIDPGKDIRRWSLNDVGRARVLALARDPGVLARTTRMISSDETKALETAAPLAAALGLRLEVRPELHENDRSSTGFLPPEEFERVADRFFAEPSQSVRGWETAQDAQTRVVTATDPDLKAQGSGDLLFVGHGGVGTLLYCALSGQSIDRRFDQGSGGGGCWFAFDLDRRQVLHGWRQMEELSSPEQSAGLAD
jgi:broad specificity phosphatase PhoE